MPAPSTPSQKQILQDILAESQVQTAAIQNLEAAILAQSNNIEITANFLRLMYESQYGSDTSSTGIWDGTDRY